MGEVRLIGRLLLSWVRSPFLKTGVTRASFQRSGSVEISMDLLNEIDKGMLSSSAHSLRQKVANLLGQEL